MRKIPKSKKGWVKYLLNLSLCHFAAADNNISVIRPYFEGRVQICGFFVYISAQGHMKQYPKRIPSLRVPEAHKIGMIEFHFALSTL